MTDKKQRVYVIPKRKGVADYWHDFRTWIGNTANDIYNAYEEGTKDLDKYYVNMQGSTGGLSDEGEIYIPTQDNASDHIQKVTAKDALDGTLIGLAESGLLSSTLAGAISAPITTGASMVLPYAVDYANQHNIFGASDNQKEMASDLAAFTPIGGLGKRFINPRTFKYNFYPKQYVRTAMRRDIAKKEIENINTAINEGTYNQTLNFGNKMKLYKRKKRLNEMLANTNNVENFYLPNRLNVLRNDINANLFGDNKLVNYIVNNPKTAYATAGMISTLPFLYPYYSTSVNTTRPPLNAEYPTSSNITVPPVITSTDTARVSNNDTAFVSKKDTVRTNRTDTAKVNKVDNSSKGINNNSNTQSDKNYVNVNTKQDTTTINRNNNRNSSNNSSNNSNNGSSGNKNNTSSSKTNEEFTKDTNNTNTQNTTKTKKKSKKQRRKEAEQQTKLAQLRQAMAEANSKVLDDVDKEMYYYGRRGPVYTGNRSII